MLHKHEIVRRGRNGSVLVTELKLFGESTSQVHGPQCLRCTYSTVKKVSAKHSCCTAVRDRKAYAIQRCQVGEML